ncbi:MAG: hypothetical protein EHM21_07175 [Chloroflexi bacterium]|nr:MAG: hypothetical protein EHM21_07175 [Chloroflexota bacterium]
MRESVFYRFDQLRIRVFYALNPPEEAVFTPDEQVANVVRATLTQAAAQATATLTPTATVTATALPPDVPTATATFTPAPPPESALVENVPYVDQHYGFNNCAPANLTMALQFWNWGGTRESVSESIKPFAKDKNVMPYELVDFVNSLTDLRALMRVGGTPETLKRLISAGYPVIVERGVYLRDLSGKVSWMGHYQVVYGYDDKAGQWQVKDSFEKGGDHFNVGYNELIRGWRSFDYAFLVIYPPENEGEVLGLLGSYADEANSNQIAAQIASDEIASTQGQDQFFALFNRGTSLQRLQDFNGAAQAFDEAFAFYAKLSGDQRPWRMLWYQTGPYFAYYYIGRYNDVINLADKTINTASEPYLEESFYWRAMAKIQLGDQGGAVEDLKQSLEFHPGFIPSVVLLQQVGGQ